MLRWQHDFGSTIEHWENVLRRGGRAPDPYLDRPELWPESQFFWTAFHDLATERQIGMGLGPIPRSAAVAYAAEYGITEGDEFDRFWAIIRTVDAEQLKLANTTKKKDRDSDSVRPVKSDMQSKKHKPKS